MTIRCELCDRASARQALTPTWYSHVLCDRPSCRAAARDAVEAVLDDREKHRGLIGAISRRNEAQAYPVGYRDDAMAEIDVVDEREWWANEVVKRV